MYPPVASTKLLAILVYENPSIPERCRVLQIHTVRQVYHIPIYKKERNGQEVVRENVGGNPTEEDAFVGIVKSEVGYCEFQCFPYIGI